MKLYQPPSLIPKAANLSEKEKKRKKKKSFFPYYGPSYWKEPSPCPPPNDKKLFTKYCPISGSEIWKSQRPLSTKVLGL